MEVTRSSAPIFRRRLSNKTETRTLVFCDKAYTTFQKFASDNAEPLLHESRLIGTLLYLVNQ
jgi:hypothetical protein